MSIAEQTLYNSYTPNGVTTVFAYGFALFREDDLIVELDGVVLGSGFSVSGVGTRSGGSVTFTTAPTGTMLVIKLAPVMDRDTDYQEVGDLLASTINRDFDRLWQAIQHVRHEYDVAIKLPFETAIAQEITDTAADRANKIVGFDGSGNASAMAPVDFGLATVTAFAETLLDDANAAAARTTLGTAWAAQTQEGVRYGTGGSAPAYTLTPTPAIVAYAAGQRFTAVAHAAGTEGSNTLNVSGLGAKSIKQYDASGNKRDGIVQSGQIVIAEYDGTDFVILNPLPAAPISFVRQTVQSGPASSGAPSFLPSTATGLSITSQNISTTNPLIVAAASGFGAGADRIGKSTANLTWPGLTNSTTNYLYVDVASDGSLTAGSTVSAPVYKYSGAPSINIGVNTFDVTLMKMHAGNSTEAPVVWRVFVGEVVTSGGDVTSSIAYAYNGVTSSAEISIVASAAVTIDHKIGTLLYDPVTVLVCKTAEAGYVAGDEVDISNYVSVAAGGAVGSAAGYGWSGSKTPTQHTIQITSSAVSTGIRVPSRSVAGTVAQITYANWRLRTYYKRRF